jgi:hypothetical protein
MLLKDPTFSMVQLQFARHVFISEHIIVSRAMLGSTPAPRDQGEYLTFCLGDTRLQHL